MVSLELTVGPWALSFSLGRAEEATTLRVVSLADLSEVAEDSEDDPEVSFGFPIIVGESGPELLGPDDLPGPGPHVVRRAGE